MTIFSRSLLGFAVISESFALRAIRAGDTATLFKPTSANHSSSHSETRVLESSCETAFARCAEAYCFLDPAFFDMNGDGKSDISRWGWTNRITGDDPLFCKLYAGAAQCDTEKGELVGTVLVTRGSQEVKFVVDSGRVLTEAHLYVGVDIAPYNVQGRYSVAPGNFPFSGSYDRGVQEGYLSSTIEMKVSSYFIFHAVVCNTADTDRPSTLPTYGASYSPSVDPNTVISTEHPTALAPTSGPKVVHAPNAPILNDRITFSPSKLPSDTPTVTPSTSPLISPSVCDTAFARCSIPYCFLDANYFDFDGNGSSDFNRVSDFSY